MLKNKTLDKSSSISLRQPDLKGEIKNGLLRSIPIMFGYFPIGFAFGVLAVNAGLGILESVLMSLLVYAGSSQLIAVSLLAGQAGLLAVTLTTFLVNLRHSLMSAALAPHLGNFNIRQLAFFSYELTDETFAVHSLDFKKEENPPPPRVFTINILAHFAWVGYTLLGAWTGSVLTNLEAWGLDYALPAMFIALLILQLENTKRIYVALFSLIFSTLFSLGLGGHWYVIISTVLAASLGLALEKANR
ncbi:MAG: AzlC family ABC transporter permease [Firmicutes bacterium]|nr:AzlC family ABC transporter permease [Bacillota bacterium]